jgi:glucose dehydrogenase
MKTTARCFLVLLLLIASIATAQQPCSGPPPTSFTNWAQFHFDNCLTGFNPYEIILSPATVGDLTVKWSFTTGNVVYSSPAVVNEVLYIGSADSKIYALNASTGALVWSYTTGGNGVVSAPAVTGNPKLRRASRSGLWIIG